MNGIGYLTQRILHVKQILLLLLFNKQKYLLVSGDGGKGEKMLKRCYIEISGASQCLSLPFLLPLSLFLLVSLFSSTFYLYAM